VLSPNKKQPKLGLHALLTESGTHRTELIRA
jgi:hypothetical protein